MQWLKRLATIAATLAYVISPIDSVPDPIAGLGQMDDLSVVIAAAWYLWRLRRNPARQ